MNTQDFNEEIKPLSDKWTNDLVKDGLFNREMTSEKIQSLAEDILKLHRPDPQYSHHESSCRKCNSTEIDTVVAKQKEEIDKLKKELDNSKFGSQCIVHELEYDKKTLIKDIEVLCSRLDKEMEAEQLLGAVIQIAEDLIEACGTIDPYKFAQKKKAQLDKIKANHSKL